MKALLQTLLFCLMMIQLHAQCQEQDYIALRALYLSTDGDNWTDNTNWPNSIFFEMNPDMPTGTDVDTWYGVETNGNGCVTELNLRENELNGSIPPEVGDLSNLTSLSLRQNQLSGSIPPEIGNLTNLTGLTLNDNQLSGSIPPEIGNLTNLTNLSLRENQLSGSIPPELGNLTNLESLYLDNNQLTGRIPPEISNLLSLTTLYLYDNELEGCYYDVLMSLCMQLDSSSSTNSKISDGNNFDAPWEDFCATGEATCR